MWLCLEDTNLPQLLGVSHVHLGRQKISLQVVGTKRFSFLGYVHVTCMP